MENTKLKQRRLDAGLTQQKLAELSGVNARMIQYYEQGYKDLNKATVETALKIADALGCDVREILNEEIPCTGKVE